MKIFTLKEFLKLPSGTIFCKGGQWWFESLMIKDESWPNDFLYIDLCTIDSSNSDVRVDRLEDSLANGTSYPINKDTSRDGMFDDDDLFLVYEEKDLEFMIGVFKEAIDKMKLERSSNEMRLV